MQMLFTPIKPMLADVGLEAFDDEDFIFEPKWDGSRMILHKQGDRLEAYTRSGRIVTDKFPEINEAAAVLREHTVILDCEGIVLRGGRPVFDDFAYRLRLSRPHHIERAARDCPATFVAFDILCTEREHLDEPLLQRKRRLVEIVPATPVITPTIYMEGKGKTLFDLTLERGLEGIVAKKKASKYLLNTRSSDWLKVKHAKTIDVMILGYRTAPFGLVMGLNFRTVKHKPVGLVDTGFSEADIRDFLKAAASLHTAKDGKTQWIEPVLCCKVQYLDRSDTHQLGAAVFKGFSPDKRPEECIWTYEGPDHLQ